MGYNNTAWQSYSREYEDLVGETMLTLHQQQVHNMQCSVEQTAGLLLVALYLQMLMVKQL